MYIIKNMGYRRGGYMYYGRGYYGGRWGIRYGGYRRGYFYRRCLLYVRMMKFRYYKKWYMYLKWGFKMYWYV